MDFEYRVFISYNKGDYEWAKKLYDELQREGYKPFLAPEDIRTASDWQQTLFQALGSSEHLLALSSSKSKVSAWVQTEIGYFLRILDEQKAQRTRKMFPVLLDEENPVIGVKQAITDIKDTGGYPGGAKNIAANIWQRVMAKIKQTITVDYSAIPIGLIILAMDQDRFDKLHKADMDDFATDLNRLLPYLRASNMAQVRDHYGAAPGRWQPFGSALDIESIATEVMNQINQKASGIKFRWHQIGSDFYKNDQKLQRQALNEMKTEVDLQAVVVDLLSLYHSGVRDQLSLLDASFDDDKTAVMVLSPVVPEPHCELMNVIEKRANQFFEHFYESQLGSRYAHCGVNVCDQREIRRLLRATLGPYIPMDRKTPSNRFF
jgi:hypothetical protein